MISLVGKFPFESPREWTWRLCDTIPRSLASSSLLLSSLPYIFYLFVRSSLPLLPRVFLSYAGRSAGSMDGRYLFFVTRNCDPVFLEGSANYARHRPPTVSRTVVLKKKRRKERKKKKAYLFFARTASRRHTEEVEHGGKRHGPTNRATKDEKPTGDGGNYGPLARVPAI